MIVNGDFTVSSSLRVATTASTTDDALEKLQSRRETFSSVTSFNAALRSEQAKMSSKEKDACVHRVFESTGNFLPRPGGPKRIRSQGSSIEP